VRLCHRYDIQAAVWENDTDQGPRYNTTFSRSYKDGEEWKSSDSFGRDDLLTVAEAARLAFLWIHEQSKAASEKDNGE
jgi:hypothetical protein